MKQTFELFAKCLIYPDCKHDPRKCNESIFFRLIYDAERGGFCACYIPRKRECKYETGE